MHLGHLAGLISGDVLARYHRLKGDNVVYVSGTDCHGTPITERAKKENTTPREICNHYHEEFQKTFNAIDFSYDLYSKTDTEYHNEKVKEVFKKLYDNGYIYEKIEPQAFCVKCNKFLQDREIQIECPKCGAISKADQCDNCGHTPSVEDLKDARELVKYGDYNAFETLYDVPDTLSQLIRTAFVPRKGMKFIVADFCV